jgi:ubiquinone/menaquinone biosynthesis C-methylase UbiE
MSETCKPAHIRPRRVELIAILWINISLQELPFDTGSFDMVHIRFVGLGVPESSWSNVFSEAARVLKRETGILEVCPVCLRQDKADNTTAWSTDCRNVQDFAFSYTSFAEGILCVTHALQLHPPVPVHPDSTGIGHVCLHG